MVLRLELSPVQGPLSNSVGQRWHFERGQRTLGRSARCDWQIPDPQCMVSKLHCLIEADRDGFVLHDKSANGSLVDGILVQEGESARLSHGTVIELAGFTFKVSLRGEKDPEFADPDAGLVLGDEHLTISSILADIAPNSQKSHGLQGRGDAWQESVSDTGAGLGHSGKSSLSRNIEIGWRGPPKTAGEAFLPEDWNTGSEFSSRLEHIPATRTLIAFTRNSKADRTAAEAACGQEPVTSIPQAVSPDALQHDVLPMGAPASVADFPELLEGLTERLEQACRDLFATFDLETTDPLPSPDLLRLPGDKMVLARLEAVLSRQIALKTAIRGLIDEQGRIMEPGIIEARADAIPGSSLWGANHTCWQAFKTHFEKYRKQLSPRDVIRQAMTRFLDGDTANSTRPARIRDDHKEASSTNET
ncbi:FHA domain-containing protein [Phyllobacterium phragmitis]|uniref:Type VI secretion system-associated FHA domain protein n=1 Tax=Phyllobacterium phragmitis TaxID=2670329 RepID=A0ABQ0H5Q8_9HYPH